VASGSGILASILSSIFPGLIIIIEYGFVTNTSARDRSFASLHGLAAIELENTGDTCTFVFAHDTHTRTSAMLADFVWRISIISLQPNAMGHLHLLVESLEREVDVGVRNHRWKL
jgi:hypothetical protein